MRSPVLICDVVALDGRLNGALSGANWLYEVDVRFLWTLIGALDSSLLFDVAGLSVERISDPARWPRIKLWAAAASGGATRFGAHPAR